MKFTYTKITGSCYLEETDEIEEFGDEFDYEPNYYSLKQVIKLLVIRDYGEKAWEMVEDFDLAECIAEGYEEELKDIFEQEAMEWYND